MMPVNRARVYWMQPNTELNSDHEDSTQVRQQDTNPPYGDALPRGVPPCDFRSESSQALIKLMLSSN